MFQRQNNILFIIDIKMKVRIIVLLFLLAVSLAIQDLDEGTKRLNQLRLRSQNSSNRIINFTMSDYNKYILKYPRPYDVVIFFDVSNQSYVESIFVQYEYLVVLYKDAGAIDNATYPTFFARMTFDKQMRSLFKQLQFETVPNIIVSKPHMAVVNQLQKKSYLKQYKWEITRTDGQVTTHKLLDFVNKRTKKQVEYKQTAQTVSNAILAFVGASVAAVLIYTFLKVIWNHWIFWLLVSLAVYVTCCSGIVYCTLNQTPFKGPNDDIISSGNRQQYGLQGWVISGSITAVGLLLVLIVVVGQKYRERYSIIVSVLALVVIYFLITHIELIYSKKSWYSPSFLPPESYLKGPLQVDQGNNI